MLLDLEYLISSEYILESWIIVCVVCLSLSRYVFGSIFKFRVKNTSADRLYIGPGAC